MDLGVLKALEVEHGIGTSPVSPVIGFRTPYRGHHLKKPQLLFVAVLQALVAMLAPCCSVRRHLILMWGVRWQNVLSRDSYFLLPIEGFVNPIKRYNLWK